MNDTIAWSPSARKAAPHSFEADETHARWCKHCGYVEDAYLHASAEERAAFDAKSTMNNSEANAGFTADAHTGVKVDNLYSFFDKLSYAEKNELSERLLRGITAAGKLAMFARTDDRLWALADGVQMDCFEAHGALIDMSLAGVWDAELRAAWAGAQ